MNMTPSFVAFRVADYDTLVLAITSSEQEAIEAVRAWYAKVKDHTYVEGLGPATVPDPATATLDEIKDWYSFGGMFYMVAVAQLGVDTPY